MQFGQVESSVVSTAKMEALVGKRLLLVESATVSDGGLKLTGQKTVCVDAVGAGAGDWVLVIMGNSSRMAADMEHVPTDAVVVAILDSLRTGNGSLLPAADPGSSK